MIDIKKYLETLKSTFGLYEHTCFGRTWEQGFLKQHKKKNNKF